MKYTLSLCAEGGKSSFAKEQVRFLADSEQTNAHFSMTFSFTEWENDAYIFLPACAYDGNRMEKYYGEYPFSYMPEDLFQRSVKKISDLPALAPDGSGKIEVTAADLSVPCFGVFYRKKKKGLLVFTEQTCKEKNIGFSVESGKIALQFPAMRTHVYRMGNSAHPSSDRGFAVSKGETVCSSVRILSFACDSIPTFFEVFFKNRDCLLSDARPPLAYTTELLAAVETHMNRDCFSGEYYAEMNKHFKCGWVGGALTALAMYGCGTPLSRERAKKTLDFMTSHTSPEGFFYGYYSDGRVMYDGGKAAHMENAMLVRKNADGLLALLKILEKYEEKEAWIAAAKKCADGFLRIFLRYGDFGQFVNVENGDIMIGGTASGASAISALALASRYFKAEKYLEAAKTAGEKYYQDFVRNGMTCGGPGDALSAPDSESAYAIVEAMVLLYEVAKDAKWLEYAKNCLYYLSTWVMPYAFRFPEACEFERLRINTVGSVFANVQNKHSAPGLCTASGDAIYKLYRYTKDPRILALLLDIVAFMPQCVSTEQRPIYSWDNPKKQLSDGWICERVNTSDWEGEGCVGGVFAYSCWPATALLLTYAELIHNEAFMQDAALN